MPPKNDDRHGCVPDESDVVPLRIDVVKDVGFEGGERVLAQALPMAERLAQLKRRAHEQRLAAIHVNDNLGPWRSDRRALVAHCLEAGVRGRPLVDRRRRDERDSFVLEPQIGPPPTGAQGHMALRG